MNRAGHEFCMKETAMRRYAFGLTLLLASTMLFAIGSPEDEGGFSYEGVRELIVEGETFGVEVQGTRSRMTVLEIIDMPDDWRVLHTLSGNQLRVWVDRDSFLFGRPHRGILRFHVPGDIQLTVKNTTGNVSVRTLQSDTINLGTSTGAIDVEDVTAEMRATATVGRVTISNSAGNADVRTTTGRIELNGTTGDMRVRSSTGSQLYRDVIGDLNARSSTGSIELIGIKGRLVLETSTGTQTGRGVVLTDHSSFTSSTGRIEMDLMRSLEGFEFDLRSTTGSLEVGGERSQKQLFLSGTGFQITGRSSTGSQKFF